VKVSGKKKERHKDLELNQRQKNQNLAINAGTGFSKKDLRNQASGHETNGRTEVTCDEHPRENHFLQGQEYRSNKEKLSGRVSPQSTSNPHRR
jgi:hypothetical protein